MDIQWMGLYAKHHSPMKNIVYMNIPDIFLSAAVLEVKVVVLIRKTETAVQYCKVNYFITILYVYII